MSKTTQWQNRIVGYKQMPANQLLANPQNPRRHPAKQREALRGALDSLGFIDAVLLNIRTNYVIDGHARIEEALTKDEDMLLPVLEVDLSEEEEALALASFDWITSLADYDRDSLDSLLASVQTDDERLQVLLDGMAQDNGLVLPEDDAWEDSFGRLADTDRELFQQKTFTLHDTQVETVDSALKFAIQHCDLDLSLNSNSNGSALAYICQRFLNEQR